MLYMIFNYGLEPVLLKGFGLKAILEIKICIRFFIYIQVKGVKIKKDQPHENGTSSAPSNKQKTNGKQGQKSS